MSRLEKEVVQQAQKVLAEAAEHLKNITPEVPRLDEALLPRPPRDDARFRVRHYLDPSGIAPFLDDAREAASVFHDQTLAVLQRYLERLKGQALPTLEDNKLLAQGVMNLTDSFGARLDFRTSRGEIKQVRVTAGSVQGRHRGIDSPAARAGIFSLSKTGGEMGQVTQTPTFPSLVAARDHTQAEQLFARFDKEADSGQGDTD